MKTSKSRRSTLLLKLRLWPRRRPTVSSGSSLQPSTPAPRAGAGLLLGAHQELSERSVISIEVGLLPQAVAFVAGLQIPNLVAFVAQPIDDLLRFVQRHPRIVLAVHDEQGPGNPL